MSVVDKIRAGRWYLYSAFMLGVLTAALLILLLQGCYDAHEAVPCDSGVMPMAGGRAVNALSSDAGGSNPPTPTMYPGPCPFAHDAVHCYCTDATHEVCDGRYCEGPYPGCIAPGSPLSSTWEGRP